MRLLVRRLSLWLLRMAGFPPEPVRDLPQKTEIKPELWLQALAVIASTPSGQLYLRGLRTRFAQMIDQLPPEGADVERTALWTAKYAAGKQILRDMIEEFETARATLEAQEREEMDEKQRRVERRGRITQPTGVD